MSQNKTRRVFFAAALAVAMATGGVGASAAAATNPEPEVVVRQIDLTQGFVAGQSRPAGFPTGKQYCTKQYNPSSCLERPATTYTSVGCDEAQDYVLVIEYTNENSRPAPIDTEVTLGGSPFGDTGLIPRATAAGPGVYRLEFRLPGLALTVRSGWSYQPSLQIGAYNATASALSC